MRIGDGVRRGADGVAEALGLVLEAEVHRQRAGLLQAAHHFGTDGAGPDTEGRVLGYPFGLLHEGFVGLDVGQDVRPELQEHLSFIFHGSTSKNLCFSLSNRT